MIGEWMVREAYDNQGRWAIMPFDKVRVMVDDVSIGVVRTSDSSVFEFPLTPEGFASAVAKVEELLGEASK